MPDGIGAASTRRHEHAEAVVGLTRRLVETACGGETDGLLEPLDGARNVAVQIERGPHLVTQGPSECGGAWRHVHTLFEELRGRFEVPLLERAHTAQLE